MARRWGGHGPIFAIGESAGANITANLAIEHYVDRAALVAGVYDLRAWNASGAFWTDVVPAPWSRRVRYTPSLGLNAARTRAPLMVAHSARDTIAPIDGASAFIADYRRHGGRVDRQVLFGDHLTDPDGLAASIAFVNKAFHQGTR